MITFELQIVTVTKSLFEGDALELHCTGTDGQMTILAKHEPFITQLPSGVLRVKTSTDDTAVVQEFSIRAGVLEVANNKVVVLCSENV